MMSQLVPQLREDKTGKLVTRHVRADARKSAPLVLPAPKAPITLPAASSGRLSMSKKPTRKQLEVGEEKVISRFAFPPSAELSELLTTGAKQKTYYVTASDHTVYEMFSCASSGNAFILLEHGIDTPELADEFFAEHGLEHLAIDRSNVISEAADRRIAPLVIADFLKTYGSTYPEHLILDAAEASESKGLEKFSDFRDAWEDILIDKLSLSDLKTVGFTRLGNSTDHKTVRKALEALHRGETNYTADDLAVIVAASDRQTPTFLAQLLSMADKYGGEYLSGVKHPFRAIVCLRNNDGRIDEETKALISYDDAVMRSGTMLDVDKTKQLMKHNVPVEKTIEMAQRGLSVDQMITTYVHGIELSVADGWL